MNIKKYTCIFAIALAIAYYLYTLNFVEHNNVENQYINIIEKWKRNNKYAVINFPSKIYETYSNVLIYNLEGSFQGGKILSVRFIATKDQFEDLSNLAKKESVFSCFGIDLYSGKYRIPTIYNYHCKYNQMFSDISHVYYFYMRSNNREDTGKWNHGVWSGCVLNPQTFEVVYFAEEF